MNQPNNQQGRRNRIGTKPGNWFLLGALAVAATIMAQPLPAALIQLTGGDPGEGYTVAPNNVYAFRMANGAQAADTNITVQGLTFQPFYFVNEPPGGNPSSITLTGGRQGSGVTLSLGASAADDAMELLLARAVHEANPAGLTLTIGGLASNTFYLVELFAAAADMRTNQYFYNGVEVATFVSSPNTAYRIFDEAMANGSGQIIVTMTGGPEWTTTINAFAVSIPEPSTILLLGAGGACWWMRRRNS
jgi:hypothetical protein